MARTFEVIHHGAYRWTEVPPGALRRGDVVRVKDDGTVVAALTPAVVNDPQTYIVFSDGTTSPVHDVTTPNSVETGVTVHHPNGGLAVIPLAAP